MANKYGKRSRKSGSRSRKAPVKAIVPKTKKRKMSKTPGRGLKLSKPMKALVDKQVNKHIEPVKLKYFLAPITGNVIDAPFATARVVKNFIDSSNMYLMMPSIVNRAGSTLADAFLEDAPVRTGNDINPTYMSVTVKLQLLASLATDALTNIKPYILIARSKQFPNGSDVIDPANTAEIFKNMYMLPATATPFPTQTNLPATYNPNGFTGTCADRILGYTNRDILSVMHQWEPTFNDPTLLGTTTVPGPPPSTVLVGSTQKRLHMIQKTFRIPLPKTMRYNTNTDLFPKAFAPILFVGWNSNNCIDSPPATTQLVVEAHATFHYTDA